MCFLRPLRVKRIVQKKVILEDGAKAYYNKKIGVLKPNDSVLVFGNLIVEKLKRNEK